MRLYCILIFIVATSPAFGQTFWAQTQSGVNVDESLATCSDGNGNSYVTGYFSTTASINGTAQSVTGLTDVFVSKTNLNGISIWVKSFGSSNSDRGLDIAVDGNGNVYICGFYKGTINFGNGISLSSVSNSQDAFIVKLNSNGEAIWAKSGGSSGASDQANGVAVDGNDNVLITGQFSGEASFGALTLTSISNTIDAFIVKYDADGNEQWAKKGSGDAIDRGVAISFDNQGNVYALGQFDGDIEFDNTYPNTIQNALFLIKYNSSGDEQWFRWAGGSDQTVPYDLECEGSSLYLTGEFGASISFFGGSTAVLNSGYDHAVFLVSYGTAGGYSWGESQGSGSAVSARGLDVNDGSISVVGWYTCTFESLSDEYGETTFNGIGFKDAFVMRYQTSGNFLWARNFGSQSDEIAHDVCLLSDNTEVIVGVFSDDLIIPIADNANVDGLNNVLATPNSNLTYCGDSNYGDFSFMSGNGNQDGFAIKAIDLDRSPYDFYQHYGTGCDLALPETCIQLSSDPLSEECPQSLIDCPTYLITAANQVLSTSDVGYNYTVTWNPSGSGNFLVQNSGEVTATISSADGCYVSTATVEVDLYDNPEEPMISDNVGVNNMALVPQTIYLCPGETADLTGHTEPGLDFYWSGPGISTEEGESITILVDEPGWYTFTVVDENGCSETNFVQVEYYDIPLELEGPSIEFGIVGDTLILCDNASGNANVFDPAYEGSVPSDGFEWVWSVAEPGTGSSTTNGISFSVTEDGWYVVTVDFETEENECADFIDVYTLSDSVYVQVVPSPTVSLEVVGPQYICSGDTFMIYIDFEGELSYDFEVVADFTDSLLVTGAGIYNITVSAINEFDCSASLATILQVQEVNSPQIFTTSETGVICPNDSVLLISNAIGNVNWQGPDGIFASDTTMVYVFESGAYFVEVSYYEGCELVSNTIEVTEYTTPFLAGSNAVLCGGDTVEIGVIGSGNSSVQWLNPLSGNDSIQLISEPGIYTAEITSCEITTSVSIEVLLNSNTLNIEQPDLSPVCDGDSILIEATPGYESYSWNPQGTDSSEYFYANGTVSATAIDEYDCVLNSNTIQVDFEPLPNLPFFDYDLVCIGEDLTVEVSSEFNIWFLDGPQGDVIQTTGTVHIPNFVSDTSLYVYLSSDLCDGPMGILELSPKLYPDSPILATNAPVCTGTTLVIDVLNEDANTIYHWVEPDGSTSQSSGFSSTVLDLTAAGEYLCFADLVECFSDTVAIDIDLFETLLLELQNDTAICDASEFVVYPNAEFQDYLWSNGSTASIYAPYEPGLITLLVHDDNGCQSFDEMTIEMVDCTVSIPNIFSPNGDGYNDTWDFSIEQAKFFDIIVFNRWGRQVFQSTNAHVSWDGTNQANGDDCSEGVYYFILNVVSFDIVHYQVSGYVTIVRE